MRKKWLWISTMLSVLAIIGSGMIQPVSTIAGGPKKASLAGSSAAYDYTNQIIVKYRSASFVKNAASNTVNAGATINARVNALSAAAGVTLNHARFMSGNGHVLKLPHAMTLSEAKSIAAKLNNDPNVEYAEPDARMYPLLAPNDTQYNNQWHYMAPSVEVGGANLPAAWDLTTGSAGLVVAVIDTGIVTHADLAGRTVGGYNFISEALRANNAVGRSADPSDLGDWVTAAESADAASIFFGCRVEDSSWHGTHVAGTIGALTNNALGVAGVNWTSKILPVRVLGKCGGLLSDITDGMRWAAGLAVAGVPANANPAKVLNMSIGGSGACGPTYQAAVNDVVAAGATLVVSAGNDNVDASGARPANCAGVISVAANDRTGGRAYYSNYGTIVKIAAPGGDTTVLTNGILSTLNTGTTSPIASPGGDTYAYYQGTSMAAPHIAGIVSLMLSRFPALTSAQVLAHLQATARAFPTGTARDCTTATCGAGIVDAAAALLPNPVPASFGLIPSTTVMGSPAFTLTINGSNFLKSSVVRWNGSDRATTFVSVAQLTATISAADIANPATNNVTVFNTVPGGGESNILQLAVIAPPPSGGGGGGGCFIATAAYGTPSEKHVSILREFRDRCLLTTPAGRAFVKFYYEVSPPIAGRIAQSDGLRFITRCSLLPFVGMAYLTVTYGVLATLASALSLILLTGLAVWMIRRKATTAASR